MSTESVVEFNCGSNDTLHNTRKKPQEELEPFQAFESITTHA